MTSLGIFRTGLLAVFVALAGCDGQAESASNTQERFDAMIAEHGGVKSFAPAYPRTQEQYDLHSETRQETVPPVTYRAPGQTNLQQYGLLLELQNKVLRDRRAGTITKAEKDIIWRTVNDDKVEIQKIEDLTRSAGALMDYQEAAQALRKSEQGSN